MKPKNFPEKVTMRRLRAAERLGICIEEMRTLPPNDTKFRLGKDKRLKKPIKFIDGVSAYPYKLSN